MKTCVLLSLQMLDSGYLMLDDNLIFTNLFYPESRGQYPVSMRRRIKIIEALLSEQKGNFYTIKVFSVTFPK
jgi:hypothetical protein